MTDIINVIKILHFPIYILKFPMHIHVSFTSMMFEQKKRHLEFRPNQTINHIQIPQNLNNNLIRLNYERLFHEIEFNAFILDNLVHG